MTSSLLEIDPNKLHLNPANVRRRKGGIDKLVASIAEVGVLVPLIVRRRSEGEIWGGTDATDNDVLMVVAGERRALAAVKAGVATVPVFVRDDVDAGSPELTAMLVENLHREDLTVGEEALGYEQLAAFGVTVEEISKLTGRDTKRISTGITVAKSPAAVEVAVKHPLTLEHLAAIAEFDGDKKAVAKLVKLAESDPRGLGYEVESLRRARERATKRATKRDDLVKNGVKVIAAKTFGWDATSKSGCRLSELVDAKGKDITTAGHKKCPGHAAAIDEYCNVVYGCTDPKTHGHTARNPGGAGTFRATHTPERKSEEQRQQEAADKEALDTATTVRRKFVKELLARKTPPKGLLVFTVPAVINQAEELYASVDLVSELTGLKAPKTGRPVESMFAELINDATDAGLQMALLAFVVTGLENGWGTYLLAPASWESNVAEALYLQFLESCGYGLSEIEQRIITKGKAKKK